MAFFSINHIALRGISASVPKTIAANKHLSGYHAGELDKLITMVGIEHRRVANDAQCASDLCLLAAEKLISDLKWLKNDIEVLFFVSQTPDHSLPGSAAHLCERLGLPSSCAAIDINQGCAGYVYGLSLISSLMSAGKLKRGLLLVGDTITRLISPNDRSLVPIFSDASTATALEYDEAAKPMVFNTSTYGKDYGAIIVPEGGARHPFNANSLNEQSYEAGIQRKGYHMLMQGLNVFAFSIGKVAPNVSDLFERSKINTSDVDFFVFHQANKLILESIAAKLRIDSSKVPSSLKNFGNTSGATIPLTIVTELSKANKLPDSTMLLSGFGVGLSIASAIVNFNGVICPDLIEA